MKLTIISTALALASLSGAAYGADCVIPTADAQKYAEASTQCSSDSSFPIVWTSSGIDEINDATFKAKFCASTACQELMALWQEFWPTECSFYGVSVRADVIDPILAVCDGSTSSSGSAVVASSSTKASSSGSSTAASSTKASSGASAVTSSTTVADSAASSLAATSTNLAFVAASATVVALLL